MDVFGRIKSDLDCNRAKQPLAQSSPKNAIERERGRDSLIVPKSDYVYELVLFMMTTERLAVTKRTRNILGWFVRGLYATRRHFTLLYITSLHPSRFRTDAIGRGLDRLILHHLQNSEQLSSQSRNTGNYTDRGCPSHAPTLIPFDY